MRVSDRRRPSPRQRVMLLGALVALAVGGTMSTAGAAPAAPAAGWKPALRVCSDPANMPFSNRNGDGFENKLAELISSSMGRQLAYTWASEDDNFLHNTLLAHRCDVVIGLPWAMGSVETTRPYYWSDYVLVSRRDRALDIASLKHHRLKGLKIGVVSVGGDRMFSPPAQALAKAGMFNDLVGFPIDHSVDGVVPMARMIAAVEQGQIAVAAVWGPAAGYYVEHALVPLKMAMIKDTEEFSAHNPHVQLIGLQFAIAMGVRKGDDALRRELNQAIAANEPRIKALLQQFGVPLLYPSVAVASEQSIPR